VSNALGKPVSFSRSKVGYFSNRPRNTPKLRGDVEISSTFMWFC